MVRNPEMPRGFWDGCGVLHEQRSCVNILPVIPKVPVMQSRVQVADGSQLQEFDPPAYLPVNTADLEGGTQSRGAVQPSSHFQVDSVPKLWRCFCCGNAGVGEPYSGFDAGSPWPNCVESGAEIQEACGPSWHVHPKLVGTISWDAGPEFGTKFAGLNSTTAKGRNDNARPEPIWSLVPGFEVIPQDQLFQVCEVRCVDRHGVAAVDKTKRVFKARCRHKKRECWQIKRFPWVHRKRFGYYGILLLEGVRRECLICMLMAW